MLFEWAVDVGDVRIEVLAEVVVLGQVLHLGDIAIFPTGTGQTSVGAAALMRALRRELIPQIRADASGGSASPESGCRALDRGVPWISPST